MPSTLKYQITYPAGNVAPNVPLAMQSTAESVEAALDTINSRSSGHPVLTNSWVTSSAVATNLWCSSRRGTSVRYGHDQARNCRPTVSP